MGSQLVIWGAGAHGKVVLDVARSGGAFKQIVFLDCDRSRWRCLFRGYPVVGGPEELARFTGEGFVIAIGNNQSRAECFARAREAGLAPARLVHRGAIVSSSVEIGLGTVVMPGAIINADALIGEDCVINSGAVVEHDCRIGDHVHISPRAVLGGGARVERFAHVGIGAVLLPGASVGEGAVVGAGAVVLKQALAHETVVGVPAKVLAHR